MNINLVLNGKSFAYQMGQPSKPIGGLMDKRFQYVPACKTNVAATIARVKAEIASGERKL